MKSFVQTIRFPVLELFRPNGSVEGAVKGIKYWIIAATLFILILPSPLYGEGGVLHSRSFPHDGTQRNYFLYVPEDYTGQDAWPLVINYHGFSSNASDQVEISGMNAIADTEHFLVAYPQGLPVYTPLIGTIRNGWHVPGHTAEHDDVAFTDSLIDHVDADFNIDLARIHSTGWSLGGVMAFYLACTLQDRIASVASVSGPMHDLMLDSCDSGRPFSILFTYGTSDPFVSYDGFPPHIPPVPTTPSFWAMQNNCSPEPTFTELPDIVTEDASTVTLIEYTDCDDDTEVLFYRINNGGHTWPDGGPLPLSFGNRNRDMNGSSVICDFFKRNPHPNPPVG